MAEDYPRERTRLYLITPPHINDLEMFAAVFETCLAAGDVACLQLRLKAANGQIDIEATRAASAVLTPIAQARDVAVIINDDPELAVELGADGVHVGAADTGIKGARQIIGPDMILGATAKDSRHVAMMAGEQGADYVAFGAFFPSQTKGDTVPAELSLLEFWQATMELPCVAIGGITIENAAPLIHAGADFLAVAGGVWDHPEGAPQAIIAFNKLLDAAYTAVR